MRLKYIFISLFVLCESDYSLHVQSYFPKERKPSRTHPDVTLKTRALSTCHDNNPEPDPMTSLRPMYGKGGLLLHELWVIWEDFDFSALSRLKKHCYIVGFDWTDNVTFFSTRWYWRKIVKYLIWSWIKEKNITANEILCFCFIHALIWNNLLASFYGDDD